MNVQTIATHIIHIPREFWRRGDTSVVSLLKESSYFQVHELITEQTLRDALLLDKNCIGEWLRFSEDKRTDSGWYFKTDELGMYTVGYFSAKTGNTQQRTFEDPIDACAIYVKYEIDEIRSQYRAGNSRDTS